MSADRAEAAATIGAVGVLIAGASAAGAATGGRSAIYQAVLIGFGLPVVLGSARMLGRRIAQRGFCQVSR